MAESVLKTKSYTFAVDIVKEIQSIVDSKKEFILSRQVIRSGTAIGALLREAEFAESTSDFIHKLSIALKEANETRYWLDVLYETGYLPEKSYKKLSDPCDELIKMLVSSVKTNKLKRK